MNDYEIVREYLNVWGERELPDYHEDEPEAALDRIEQREQRLRDERALLEELADAAREVRYEDMPDRLRNAISRWFVRLPEEQS